MKSLSIKLGVVVLIIGFPMLCYGGNVITRIGEYYIGQDIKTVRGLVEFTPQEYAALWSFQGRVGLPGEKVFNAPKLTFNGRLWYLTVGALNGLIYKLALQHITSDRAEARSIFEETLKFLKSQMGAPAEQTKTPKRHRWDSTDGNVVLAEQEASGFFSINFIVTGKEGKGAFKYVEVGGADWKCYMVDDFGGWFYDAETITRPSKDTVRVWGKTVYTDKGVKRKVKEMRAIYEQYKDLGSKTKDLETKALLSEYKDAESKYKDLSYEQHLIEFNCADIKSRTLKGTAYSRNGTILSTYIPKTPDWNEVITGTAAEMLYKILCKQPQK